MRNSNRFSFLAAVCFLMMGAAFASAQESNSATQPSGGMVIMNGAPVIPGEVTQGTLVLPASPEPQTPGSITLMGHGGTVRADSISVELQPPTMVQAAWLGVGVEQADQTLQAQLKLPEGSGLVVKSFISGSPGLAAGVQGNDVICKLDEQLLVNVEQLEVLTRTHKPGDRVVLTIMREAHEMKIPVTLVDHKVPELSWWLNMQRGNSDSPFTFSAPSVPAEVHPSN